VESTRRRTSCQDGVSRASAVIAAAIKGLRPEGVCCSRIDAGCREHAGQVDPGVPDPPALRGEAEQVLGDGKAEQLGIAQNRFPPRPAFPGHAKVRQDMVIQMDVARFLPRRRAVRR
jgi:hypothetical protein